MTVRASALARFVDCEQLRDRLIEEVDAKMAEPVADPCWQWAPIYIQQHQGELLPWALNWLEDAIERSKLGGMTYEQALQAIREQMAQCNAPQSQAQANGMRIVVHARTKRGMGSSAASAPGGASRHEARLTVSFGSGGIGPSPTECPPVPEVVFLKNIAVGNNPHAQATGAILDAATGLGPGGEPIYIQTEMAISGYLDAHPEWLEKPADVEVQIGGWRADIPGTVTLAARFELDDGQRVLVTGLAETSMSQGGTFTFQSATTTLWVPEWPDAGVHTLEAVIFLDWGGTVAVEYAQDTVLDGSYARSLAIDPWTYQGDLRIALGSFCVVDLALTELRVVGHAGGDGSLAYPFKFYRDEAVTVADLRLFNGNPIEATFRPSISSLEEVTMQPQQEIEAVAITPGAPTLRYEGIYEIKRQVVAYRPGASASYPPDCMTKGSDARSIYTDTYRELADVNKIVITAKAGQFASGTGTESDPYILNSFSQGIVEFEVRNENTVLSARLSDGIVIAAGEKNDLAAYTFTADAYAPMEHVFERTISCVDNKRCFFNAAAPVLRQLFIRRPMPTKEEFFRFFVESTHILGADYSNATTTYGELCGDGYRERKYIRDQFIQVRIYMHLPLMNAWTVSFVSATWTAGELSRDFTNAGIECLYRNISEYMACRGEELPSWNPPVTGRATVSLTHIPSGLTTYYDMTDADFL